MTFDDHGDRELAGPVSTNLIAASRTLHNDN
jgi:hypothetical protein